MRYRDYRKKMQRVKLASIILAGVTAAAIAGVVIGVSVNNAEKGKVGRIDEVFTVDATYTYGESFTPSGKAYKSDMTFEYRKVGEEEWITTQPNRVGQYEMRAKAKGSGSTYKYSTVQTFEIKPVDIDCYVNQATINYGETRPTIKVETLLGNDYYNTDDYQVTFSSFKEETAKVNVVPSSIHIFSGSEDITYCYNINFIEKEIRFIPQNLTISFDDVTKQYDGEAISSDGYTITSGSLKFNDRIEVTGGQTINEPGTTYNNHTVRIVDEDGDDVTLHYNIQKRENSLKITTIPLSIRSNSLTKTYDGTPFAESEFVLEYDQTKLLDGHHIEYEFTSANKDDYQVYSSTPNAFNYQILDAENNDVSRFYSVSTSTGTLSITKRSLAFRTKSVNTTYDGATHGDNSIEITSGSVAEGDTLSVVDFNQYTDAGNYTNSCNFSIKRTVGSDEVDVTSCYTVNKTQGTIIINRIKTNFRFLSGNVYEYDGQPHPIYSVDPENNVEVAYDLDTTQYKYSVKIKSTSLANNQKTDYQSAAYSLSRNDFDIIIYDLADNNVTNNFDINCTFESMSILKKNLTINTPDYEKYYDGVSLGTDLSDSVKKAAFEDQVNALSEGLVAGHRIKYSSISIPSANTVNASSGDFMCSYSVVDGSNVNVASNYNITVNKGQYNINKIDVTLEVYGGNKVYDGSSTLNIDTNHGVYLNILDGGFISGTTLNIKNGITRSAPSSDVGSYPYELSLNDIEIKRNGFDAKENYNITIVNSGSFQIEPRHVLISQINNFTYYDGEYHGLNNQEDFIWSGVVQGQTYYFKNAENYEEPGTYYYESNASTFDLNAFMNQFEPVVYDGTRDVTSNYIFEFDQYQISEFGERSTKGYSYQIIKKHLTIKSHTTNKVFDNEPLNPTITYSANREGFYGNNTDYVGVTFDNNQTFDPGHTLKITNTGDRPTHVADTSDSTKNQSKFNYQIVDAQNNDVTDRYVVDVIYGALEITKCNLKVYLKNVSSIYSSKNISLSTTKFKITKDYNSNQYAYLANSNPIPSNHTLWVTLTVPTGNTFMAQNYYVDVSLILEEDITPGEFNTNDINLYLRSSQLKWSVTPAPLSIVTQDVNWTYIEGKAAPETRTVTGLKSNDKIYFGSEQYTSASTKYYTSVTDKINVGTYTNEVGPYQILRGSVDVTSCYQISITLGTVRIVADD